jgi:proteasome lid subunit RPN8/RPN11
VIEMFISMSKQLYNELVAYCKEQQPMEACGFIQGKQSGSGLNWVAESLIPVSNCSTDPLQHFEMNPTELTPILFNKSTDSKLLGIFHSHPLADAVPSKEDLNTMWHPLPSYWIVSLQNQAKPVLQIYQIKKAPLTAARKLSHAIDQ